MIHPRPRRTPASRLLLLLFALLATVVSAASTARAGDGAIRDGRLDLSVMFTYRESDPDSWRPVFEEASRLLYNATDGQVQFGTIRVLGCSYRKDAADVWVLGDNSGAFANLLGLGGIGHVYVSQTHKSTLEPALGQFGLVHELGHYVFGTFDEYKGFTQPGGLAVTEQTILDAPYQFCTTEDDPVACIMDGGTLVAPNHRRTEFCSHAHGGLPTEHNTGIEVDGTVYINAQQALNGESCWETIARIAGLQQPDSVTTADPEGLEPIVWEVVPPYDRLAIAFDRSVSMSLEPERLALAREAAALLTALLPARKTVTIEGVLVTLPGSHLSIVSFAQAPTIEQPIGEIESEAMRDSLSAAFETIATPDPAILSTDLGAGVGASLNEILSEGEIASCTEAVVLFSDGGHNLGADPVTLLPELLERGVRVYAVGLGDGIDEALLRMLADSTGGAYYGITEAEQIPGLMAALSAQLRGGGQVASSDDSTSGQDEYLPVFVDSFLEEIIVLCSWEEGSLDMQLITPTGEEIDLEDADTRPDVEGGRLPGVVFLRVIHPEAGEWLARVRPIEIPGPVGFTVTVLDQSRSVALEVSTNRDSYTWPEEIRVRADLIADVPVAGAMVWAVVERAGGTPVQIELKDDGAPENGDTWANDGVYNAIFREFAGDGDYTFHVTAANESGTGPDPNLPFVEDGPGPPIEIPPFVRQASITVAVSGAGTYLVGDLDFDPRVLSPQGNSSQVTAYVELPPSYDPAGIDPASVLINGSVEPLVRPLQIGDHDGDGVPDAKFKFLRADLLEILPIGPAVEVRLGGALTGGERFEAADTIAVIDPGPHPVRIEPDSLRAGDTARLSWTGVAGSPVTYHGFVSSDGGARWTEIFAGLSEETSFSWRVPPRAGSELQFLVQAESPEGVLGQELSGIVPVFGGAPTGVEEIPTRTAFLGPSANPARGGTDLRFVLGAPAPVRLELYDVTGRIVRHLVSGTLPAGAHASRWDGTDMTGRSMPSGVYLYSFEAGSYATTGRLTLIR